MHRREFFSLSIAGVGVSSLETRVSALERTLRAWNETQGTTLQPGGQDEWFGLKARLDELDARLRVLEKRTATNWDPATGFFGREGT